MPQAAVSNLLSALRQREGNANTDENVAGGRRVRIRTDLRRLYTNLQAASASMARP